MLENIPYKASFTREQFMFYEMKITARLVQEGLTDNQIIEKIYTENMFQYPTEKSTKRMVKACLTRLRCMGDDALVTAISNAPQDVAKQICLYAMMKQYRVIGEFMVTVIGEKYRLGDLNFGKIDLNMYFAKLQEQDEMVAEWSEATITKLKQVMLKLLVDAEYIDSTRSTILNPVWLYPVLENVLRAQGEEGFLKAFNRFD